jgi:hypothetical protein
VAVALVLSGGAAFWAGAESVVAEELEQNLYLFVSYISTVRPACFISIFVEFVIVGQ